MECGAPCDVLPSIHDASNLPYDPPSTRRPVSPAHLPQKSDAVLAGANWRPPGLLESSGNHTLSSPVTSELSVPCYDGSTSSNVSTAVHDDSMHSIRSRLYSLEVPIVHSPFTEEPTPLLGPFMPGSHNYPYPILVDVPPSRMVEGILGGELAAQPECAVVSAATSTSCAELSDEDETLCVLCNALSASRQGGETWYLLDSGANVNMLAISGGERYALC